MTASTCSIGSSASQRTLWRCALILLVLVALSLPDDAGSRAAACGWPNTLGDEAPPILLGVTSETNGCKPRESSGESEEDEVNASTGGDLGPHRAGSKGRRGTGAGIPPHSPLQDAPKQGPPSELQVPASAPCLPAQRF